MSWGKGTFSFQCWEVTIICLAAVVQASVREEKKLMVENAKLKSDIEELKKQLLEKEKKRGGMLSSVPSKDFHPRSNVCLSLEKTLMLLSSISSSRKRFCVPDWETFDVSCCSLECCLACNISDNILCILASAYYNQIFFDFIISNNTVSGVPNRVIGTTCPWAMVLLLWVDILG